MGAPLSYISRISRHELHKVYLEPGGSHEAEAPTKAGEETATVPEQGRGPRHRRDSEDLRRIPLQGCALQDPPVIGPRFGRIRGGRDAGQVRYRPQRGLPVLLGPGHVRPDLGPVPGLFLGLVQRTTPAAQRCQQWLRGLGQGVLP